MTSFYFKTAIEVFLWINQIPRILWNKFIISISVENVLLEKFFLNLLGSNTTNIDIHFSNRRDTKKTKTKTPGRELVLTLHDTAKTSSNFETKSEY